MATSTMVGQGEMVDPKVRLLLTSLREIAIQIIATIEDYLDHPYDKSALAKRRREVCR